MFYPTGGNGTGGGLGSQGAIAMDDAGDNLYLVNAASDTISVFDLTRKEPTLIDIVSTGGMFPNSVAHSGDLLYVLNAGGSVGGVDAITGFMVAASGKLARCLRTPRGASARRRCSPPRSAFPRTTNGSS